MDVQEALLILNPVLQQEGLNDIQELVFRHVWEGRTYPEIATSSGFDAGYIKNVGSRLWKLLSNALGRQVTKSNLRSVVQQQLQKTQVATVLTTPSDITDIDTARQLPVVILIYVQNSNSLLNTQAC